MHLHIKYPLTMFCLSFLVAFPKKLKQNPPPKKKPLTETTASDPQGYEPLPVGMKNTCNINYSLLNGFQYKVDVCSWGEPGKVYTSGDNKAIKCVLTEKLSIICFTVYHTFTELNLSEDDIIKLQNQWVTFKFSDSKSQMSSRAQSDAPKYFFDCSEPSNELSFGILHEGKTSAGPENITEETKLTFANMEEEAALLNVKVLSKLGGKPFTIHQRKLLDVIEELDGKFPSESVENSEKGGSGKSRTGKKTPLGKDSNIIKFNCSQLLLDKIMIYKEKIQPAKQIQFVAVIVSATDLISKEIRQSLFPFCVEIKHLQGIPTNNLSMSHIFLKYSLDKIFNEETEKIEVRLDNPQNIEFDYSKVLFINRLNIAFSHFIEALQTGLFYIECYGIVDDNEAKEKTLTAVSEESKTTDKKSEKSSKAIKGQSAKKGGKGGTKKKNRLLAIAHVNLNDMIKSILWTDYNIHLTSILPYEDWWNFEDDQDEIKALSKKIMRKEREIPYFSQKDLIESGTIMKIRLRNGDLIHPLLLNNVSAQENVLSRIIVIFKDKNNSSAVSDILNINNEIQLEYPNRRTFDMLLNFQTAQSTISIEDFETEDNDYIGGFVIDTLDRTYSMTEGLLNFNFSKVLGVVARLHKKKVKVLYNSSLVFNKRLYPDFNKKMKDIITLQEPMSITMKPPYNVLRQKIPLPALRAMTKLQSIVECHTMTEVCARKLFPSLEELSSLKSEFGYNPPVDNVGDAIIQLRSNLPVDNSGDPIIQKPSFEA